MEVAGMMKLHVAMMVTDAMKATAMAAAAFHSAVAVMRIATLVEQVVATIAAMIVITMIMAR